MQLSMHAVPKKTGEAKMRRTAFCLHLNRCGGLSPPAICYLGQCYLGQMLLRPMLLGPILLRPMLLRPILLRPMLLRPIVSLANFFLDLGQKFFF